MSRREHYATVKNPPRSVGTVFDTIRNAPHGCRGDVRKAAQVAYAKTREKRLKAVLSVDFSKRYQPKGV